MVEVLLHGMLHQRMSSLKAPRHTTHRQSIRMTYKFNRDRVDKDKGMFLYSAVLIQSVGPHKALYSLHFTVYTFLPSQTCSFRHQLGFSRKHSSHAAITRNDVYSQVLIYTAESTGCQRREQKYPNFETVATGGFEPGLT